MSIGRLTSEGVMERRVGIMVCITLGGMIGAYLALQLISYDLNWHEFMKNLLWGMY